MPTVSYLTGHGFPVPKLQESKQFSQVARLPTENSIFLLSNLQIVTIKEWTLESS